MTQLEHWTRDDDHHRWESKDGEWFAYDQWSCGRITDMRRAYDIPDDHPAWNEMYAFARSRTAGRVDDGKDNAQVPNVRIA
jgi:hypothetical protein